MKFCVLISILSLIISGFALYQSQQNTIISNNDEIHKAVTIELANSERKLVENLTPNFRLMFEGQSLKADYGENWKPKTIEELATPLMDMVNGLEEE